MPALFIFTSLILTCLRPVVGHADLLACETILTLHDRLAPRAREIVIRRSVEMGRLVVTTRSVNRSLEIDLGLSDLRPGAMNGMVHINASVYTADEWSQAASRLSREIKRLLQDPELGRTLILRGPDRRVLGWLIFKHDPLVFERRFGIHLRLNPLVNTLIAQTPDLGFTVEDEVIQISRDVDTAVALLRKLTMLHVDQAFANAPGKP